MKFALLDDQKNFHEEFKTYSSKYLNSANCNFYYDSKSLFIDIEEKNNIKIDVVFLDIELDGESGIDIAKKLYHVDPSIVVVFLTNKNHMVYEAFGLNVLKFIYKPTFYSQVDTLFHSLFNELEMIKPIQFKSADSVISLTKKEVILISRELRKIIIYTRTGKCYETNIKGIQEAFQMLGSEMFAMINRSEIVNLSMIQEINGAKLSLRGLNKSCYISYDRIQDIKLKWRNLYV